MHKFECTIRIRNWRTTVLGRRCVCIHQVAALFCVKWLTATILKVWRIIENPAPSIDTHLLEFSCQISSRSDLKRNGAFKKVSPPARTRRTKWFRDQFLRLIQKYFRCPINYNFHQPWKGERVLMMKCVATAPRSLASSLIHSSLRRGQRNRYKIFARIPHSANYSITFSVQRRSRAHDCNDARMFYLWRCCYIGEH